jgi:glycerophosphoryl diester phosphodiesterase
MFTKLILQVVLKEGAGRRVIFSTFDPDCATLLSLKQPRFPVLFLTCGGTKQFDDPRMNSLDAALQFALASQLQVRWCGARLCVRGRSLEAVCAMSGLQLQSAPSLPAAQQA